MKLISLALFVCLTGAGADPEILNTIRTGDLGALRTALRQGANPNAADPRGTSALHYAALYSSGEAMAALIQAGARVNAANRAGVTPLFTALGDLAKVKLLVEKGADVNARSKADLSPIRNAANLPSGAPVVEYLLTKGAKPDSATLSGAVSRRDVALAKLLISAGVVVSPNLVDAAASSGSVELLRTVLPAKPSRVAASKGSQSSRTALMDAAYYGPAESVRLLLEAGAEVDTRDNRGRTALMHAAGSDHSEAAVLQLLLGQGADRSLKDERGDTALDFAQHRGDAAKIRLLGGEPATPPSGPMAPVTLPPVRVAVERALRQFDKAGPAFFRANACISCHHQSIPQMAAAEAERAGLAMPEPAADAARTKSVLAIWGGETDSMWQSVCRMGGGGVATATYGLVGLASARQLANPVIDAAASCLLKLQGPDGSWRTNDKRPPLGMNPVKYTALAIRALQSYPLPGLRNEFDERIARGKAFIEAADSHGDTQTLAFKVLGMKWAGSDSALIRAAAAALTAAQHSDGGWSQQVTMPSDAYATGQAVWALREGAGVSQDDADWQRGVQYLRSTQEEDGSWHVRSRGFGFQPYRDTGFPHGHDQWISTAATGFAVMAIAPLIESVPATAARR